MPEERDIRLPADQAERLAKDAQRMGLSVPAYLLLLERVREHKLDPQFVSAVKFVFTKYGKTLRRLAQ